MAVNILDQISLKNIFLFDSTSYVNEDSLSIESMIASFLSPEIEDFEVTDLSSTYTARIVSALTALSSSSSFQNALVRLGQHKRLMIDVMPTGASSGQMGEVIYDSSAYTLGLLGLGNLQLLAGIQFIRADGTVGIGVSVEQALAHEFAHAMLEANDTTWIGTQVDFHGDAVRFENQVSDELGGRWDYRPGYFAFLESGLNLTIPSTPLGQSRTSWTDGQAFDTVVRDVSSISNVAAPGKNIDLTGRTEIEKFLIIAHVDTTGQSIASGEGDDYIYALNGNDVVSAMGGGDYVDGGNGNDTLFGGEGDDRLLGNLNQDALFGGAGDDILFFDAQDLNFNGGNGFDIAQYAQIDDQRALVIDMGAREIEVLISGNKADRIIADGEGPLLIAAGGGSDSIAVQNGRGSPTIVMGGSGRDTFNVQMDPNDNDPAGLLVIRVAGLTTENFGRLTLDMLGLPDDFDWSQIDLVVVNPEATDRITLNGGLVNARTVSNPLTYFWTDPDTGEQHSEDIGTLTETLFQQSVETEDWTMLWDRRVGSISSNFLNGDTFAYAPRIGVSFEQVVEYRDSEGRTFLPGSGQPDEMIYDYDLGSPDMSSGWFNFGYGARVHYYEDTFVDPDWLPESWFIYGGRVTSDGTLSTTLSTTLPPDF